MLMKNSNDSIWNRTRDLPACSVICAYRNHKIKGFKYFSLFVLSCLSFQKHKGPLFAVHVHVIGVRFYYFLPVKYSVVADR